MCSPTDLPGVAVSVNVSTVWALVSWSPPPSSRYPLVVSGYRIVVRSASEHDYEVSAEENSFNITQLQPGSAWIVGVAYISGRYESEMSELVRFETLEGVLIVSHQTGSSVLVPNSNCH